jgi:uncharacterized coiled-coil protein SlyX
VRVGESINQDRLDALETTHDEQMQSIIAETEHEVGSSQALAEAERDQLLYVTNERKEKQSAEIEKEKLAVKQEYDGRINALEKLQALQILTEVQRNELLEDGRGIFKASMGASPRCLA